MMSAAAILSKSFPKVRAELYIVGDKLYFGEFTFASLCGLMDYFTPKYLDELGRQIVLPRKKRRFSL